MLQGELMRTGSSELSTIYCMGEGLENKFKKEIVRVVVDGRVHFLDGIEAVYGGCDHGD